jgi:serine/threonine protein kinase
MDAERWRRTKELFNAALARAGRERESYLEAACGGDAELRAEVESLIRSHEADGEFMDAPAAKMLAASGVGVGGEVSPGLESGGRVGSYRIEGVLGEGGMGKVYLAEDARLGRKVALKLLPASFTLDEERVRRFEQEARAASSLNHPGILTIYEISADGPTRFMATEYVEGVTLRERLRRGGLGLHEALDVGVQ